MSNEDDSEFKVKDKRRFSSDGSTRADGGVGDKPEARVAEQPSPKSEPQPQGADAPDVDFTSFVVSLATQALVMMGEIPHPETGQPSENLEAAQQTIDIIGMLEAKTKGNLSADEEKMIGEVLASLRMAFVGKKTKQS